MLVVAGDGGFMMNSQEVETARRLKLNLVVLIIEDYAYGMIRWKQAVDGFADWGLTFGNPDFVAYAASYGAQGRRVTTASGLAPALEQAFAAGGVQLVAVPIDYSENIRVLVDELRHMQDEDEPARPLKGLLAGSLHHRDLPDAIEFPELLGKRRDVL